MKTLELLKKRNSDLTNQISVGFEKENKKINKLIAINNDCIAAIERGVTEDQMKSGLKSTTETISKVKNGYTDWFSNTPGSWNIKNPRSKYYSIMGVKKLNDQVEFMKYMLDLSW